jgi:hypothetical protein
MHHALFSFLDENSHALIPKIQEKMTGKADLYQFLKPNIVYYHLPVISLTPIGHFLIGQLIAYSDYNVFINHKSHEMLHYLSKLNEAEFKQFMSHLQKRIQTQSYKYAMQLHQWNDSYALLAEPDSPFTPVFTPNKIIDCKGIKAIKENPAVKAHFLTSVNQHLKLSPHERIEFFNAYSSVRIITQDDCHNSHLSPALIGQQGVFALVDLPQYFFLGFYSGYYFANPMTAHDYFNKMGTSTDIYLFGHKDQERPIVSAYRGGNRISLINSATDYSGTAQEIAHQLFYVQNTLPLDFKTDNNPDDIIRNSANMFDMSGYVTIRPVKAGEQLLVDYGYDYWHNQHQHCFMGNNDFTKATSQEIDDAYLLLKEQKI